LEYYAHSAALPEVESSSIKADLHRRDFTINTLAIRLDSGHYGKLLDFYGGEQDLEEGVVRALHSLSFIEDPTRIMRAVRFEQRLNFRIEPRTEELIENALSMMSRVSGERVRHELDLILRERRPENILDRLDALGVLAQIHPRLAFTAETKGRFEELRRHVAEGRWPVAAENGQPSPGLYLAVMTYPLGREAVKAIASRLKPFRQDMTLLEQLLDLKEREEALARPELANHEIYQLLRYSSSAARLVYWLCTPSEPVRRRLWRYESELRHVEPLVDGEYLKGLGLKPSPLFSKLLNAVRDARLDGQIETLAQEKELVANLLAGREGR
jgi:tRNA nucleotidyltransferase (CCA-adding enzyme)